MSNSKIVVNDLIILGNACPDELKDHRIAVCTAGYSPTYGLIRVYPVPPRSQPKRWTKIEVPLERNPTDARSASWKIEGSKGEWDRLHEKIIVKGKVEDRSEQIALVDMMQREFGVNCVEDLNGKKASLGMIEPNILAWDLAPRDEVDSSTQSTLTGEVGFWTKKNYPYKPMVTYRCPSCRTVKPHHQQIVEWGVYEWMRHNTGKESNVWENLRFGEKGYRFNFLVGNQALYPTSFMVISVFRWKAA
jgi:hypothetical protein